jgi:dTDP-glucose 4,6-dehydratase
MHIPVYGDGKQKREWLYVSDHCAALALALSLGRRARYTTLAGKRRKILRS